MGRAFEVYREVTDARNSNAVSRLEAALVQVDYLTRVWEMAFDLVETRPCDAFSDSHPERVDKVLAALRQVREPEQVAGSAPVATVVAGSREQRGEEAVSRTIDLLRASCAFTLADEVSRWAVSCGLKVDREPSHPSKQKV